MGGGSSRKATEFERQLDAASRGARTRAWHCSDHGRTSPCTRMQILRCVQESRWSRSSPDMPCSQHSMTCLLEKDTCRLDTFGMTARPWCLEKYLLHITSTLLLCFHIYQGHMSCMIGSLHCPAHLTCIWCTLRLLWNLNTNLSGSRYKCPRFCRTCQDRWKR